MVGPASFRFTLRAKLLLLSVVILGIPYIGLEYIRELESHLRDVLEVSLVDAARGYAGLLHGRDTLFTIQDDDPDKSLYVHEMVHPVQIDGYSDDWNAYITWSDIYGNIAGNEDNDEVFFKLIVGQYQQNLYILIQVRDTDLVYRQANQPENSQYDRITMVMDDSRGRLHRYHFAPNAPGGIRPYTYRSQFDEFGDAYLAIDYATNIKAEWQKSAEGYNLEIMVPLHLPGERMGFVVTDSDGEKSRSLGTAGEGTAASPGRLLRASAEIEAIIDRPAGIEGRRAWVLNNQGQVLASSGSLDKSLQGLQQNLFYSLILPAVPSRVRDDLAGRSRLQGAEVMQALRGKTMTQWRSSPDGATVIVSAATPVRVNEEVRGVVVVEESSSSIQMLQRNAMVSLFNKTLVVFVVVTGLLLLFATRLSSRIKRLSTDAASAIDEHGRVIGEFRADNTGDEIGDLSKNYAAMLGRLREYNHYLENMAGRLSHELRTPLAVVQSSLEQLRAKTGSGDAAQAYLERAQQGMERLGLILNRLSEASRIEQAMQGAEKRETAIVELITNCAEGYQLAYPDRTFRLNVSCAEFRSEIAPDLFVQMLDKLIANASDFSLPDRDIEIDLDCRGEWWSVTVSNFGPCLPAGMEDQLFNSMVSLRCHGSDTAPHLGLGLFIVRLIVEYMNGRVSATNFPAADGVSFRVELPR